MPSCWASTATVAGSDRSFQKNYVQLLSWTAGKPTRREYDEAFMGIAPKRVGGPLDWTGIYFVADDDSVCVRFSTHGSEQVERTLAVLMNHNKEVVDYCDTYGLAMGDFEGRRAVGAEEIKLWLASLEATPHDLPYGLDIYAAVRHYPWVEDSDDMLAWGFWVLFPIYQAVMDLKHNRADRFLDYLSTASELCEPPLVKTFEANVESEPGESDPSAARTFFPATPDPELGRRGEVAFAQWLEDRCGRFEWMNRDGESRQPYDFAVDDPRWDAGGGRLYVDVKTSEQGSRDAFIMSFDELKFAASRPDHRIARVRVMTAADAQLTILTGSSEIAARLVESIRHIQLEDGTTLRGCALMIESRLLRVVHTTTIPFGNGPEDGV